MIRTVKGELVAECNECGTEHASGTLEWSDFIADLKKEGWRIKKEDDEWCHYCSDCQ